MGPLCLSFFSLTGRRREGNTVEGGKDRFDDYYEMYKDYVIKNLKKLTKTDEELTEDLSQEVWLAFYREMDRVIPFGDAGIRGWLYVVGRHKYLDFIKQAYRERELTADDWTAENRVVSHVEDGIITRLMFENYVAGLSQVERTLILCRICGIPPREALPDLDCTDNALNVRCTRAMQKLQDYMRK